MEMSAGHPDRAQTDEAQTDGHGGLEFVAEVWEGDINIGVKSVWVALKTMGLDVITQMVSVAKEEKRSEGRALEFSNFEGGGQPRQDIGGEATPSGESIAERE